jgi:hypothetical protein
VRLIRIQPESDYRSKAAVITSFHILEDVEDHFLDWGRMTGSPEVIHEGKARLREESGWFT